MKKLIAILLLSAILLSMLGSCENNKATTETTIADTEPQKKPEIEVRKSKAYPNALKAPSYSLLNNNEKLLYEAIAKLIASPQASKKIALKQAVAVDSFHMIIDIFKANFATHSDVLENISYIESEGKITAVYISDSFDETAFSEKYEALSSKADEIIASIPTKLSDKEIVFELIDYLIENTTLVNEYEETTAYTALIENKADSEGIAKAFDLLLKKAGIQSFTVYGFVKEYEYVQETNSSNTVYKFPEPRSYWNYIYLWNNWYEVDIKKLYIYWFDGAEFVLDIDRITLLGNVQYPYYFHRNDIENMIIPITEKWLDNKAAYESDDDVIKLIESIDLWVLAENSTAHTLQFKFKTVPAAEKFLEKNNKIIKDKTGTEFTLSMSKEPAEPTVINITPVKVVDFDNLSYYSRSFTFNHCVDYNKINIPGSSIIEIEPLTISFDIPEYWTGGEGIYNKFYAHPDYPGYTNAMSIYQLTKLPSGVAIGREISKTLMGGEPFESEYFSGTTTSGNKYCYYLQKEPLGIEGYYYFFVQISDEYVVYFYITDSLEREHIIMQLIDSVQMVNN